MKLERLFGRLWVALGLSVGAAAATLVANTVARVNPALSLPLSLKMRVISVLVGLVIGGLCGFFTRTSAYRGLEKVLQWLQSRPLVDLVAGGGGLLAGLVIASLPTRVTALIANRWLAVFLTLLLYGILGYMGVMLGLNHREGWRAVIPAPLRNRSSGEEETPEPEVGCKVLDSSVLIDGRVERILETGFLEGMLVIPAFVLREMQHLADSEDEIKRARGRRGLDTAAALQERWSSRIQVTELDNERIPEVDTKLVWLARQMQGSLMTNDYNLQKLAAIQNTRVLNVHSLTQALRTVTRPGDRIRLKLVKEGKEPGQAVGYLEDGTMVVVVEARDKLGQETEVTVTSSLQTNAGRLIFARIE